MEIDLAIEIKANPLAQAGAVNSFDPRRAALAVDRIGGIIGIALYCQSYG